MVEYAPEALLVAALGRVLAADARGARARAVVRVVVRAFGISDGVFDKRSKRAHGTPRRSFIERSMGEYLAARPALLDEPASRLFGGPGSLRAPKAWRPVLATCLGCWWLSVSLSLGRC